MASLGEFKFGIEHEFPCIDAKGQFVDFSSATFEDLDRIIGKLPFFEKDYPGLRIGDLKIKRKRWYVEGFERWSEEGRYERTNIKGFEIRTPICASIDEAVATLKNDFELWRSVAAGYGYVPAGVALNPFKTDFVPNPPLNTWEIEHRRTPEERTAYMHMLTYGPDVSFSNRYFDLKKIIDIGRKLTFYSPFIVPWSFSSPFYNGALWEGLSRRTYYRTGARPAALVFIERSEDILDTNPTLTEKARISAEIGRIEFKAFDTLRDLDLYGSLTALVTGLALDDTLGGRLDVPNADLHKLSALYGFHDDMIREGAQEVLDAVMRILPEHERRLVEKLEAALADRVTPSDRMIQSFKTTNDIMETIRL